MLNYHEALSSSKNMKQGKFYPTVIKGFRRDFIRQFLDENPLSSSYVTTEPFYCNSQEQTEYHLINGANYLDHPVFFSNHYNDGIAAENWIEWHGGELDVGEGGGVSGFGLQVLWEPADRELREYISDIIYMELGLFENSQLIRGMKLHYNYANE